MLAERRHEIRNIIVGLNLCKVGVDRLPEKMSNFTQKDVEWVHEISNLLFDLYPKDKTGFEQFGVLKKTGQNSELEYKYRLQYSKDESFKDILEFTFNSDAGEHIATIYKDPATLKHDPVDGYPTNLVMNMCIEVFSQMYDKLLTSQ